MCNYDTFCIVFKARWYETNMRNKSTKLTNNSRLEQLLCDILKVYTVSQAILIYLKVSSFQLITTYIDVKFELNIKLL